MSRQGYRTEHDSMGEIRVPEHALYGAQTQRAVTNFPVSGYHMPRAFLRGLGLVKAAAARANAALGDMDAELAAAIEKAALAVVRGEHDEHFPIDVFQTGSGTSSNMNANEVIARLASQALGRPVHPNDDVNRAQSSNDVIPSAIHVAAALAVRDDLAPALAHLERTIADRAGELEDVVKTGRTHLMDAMPVTLGQELGGWAGQMRSARERIDDTLVRVRALAIGGTAVGTGINARPGFGDQVVAELNALENETFRVAADRFEAMSGQDASVELSGQLRVLAVALMKVANDLRWMNSGPLAGLGEISLPALQPGSSIMPGKVNPVVPESVAMVSAQVMGHDASIAVAGQSGNFQLNVMLPLVAWNLLESVRLLANASRLLADGAVAGFTVNRDRLDAALSRNPILVTALNTVVGYEQGAAIAKRAYAEGRPVLEVAREMTDIPENRLRELLDPARLTRGGLPGGD